MTFILGDTGDEQYDTTVFLSQLTGGASQQVNPEPSDPPSIATPEPMTAMLAVGSMVGLVVRRRR